MLSGALRWSARKREPMVEGLLFLIACVGIGVLAIWVMQNDAAGPTERIGGLFAMRSDGPGDQANGPGSQRRAPGHRRSRSRR